MKALPLLVMTLAAAGCTAGEQPTPRFANAPPVTIVDDRRNVPVTPERKRYLAMLFQYDGNFHKRVDRALTLPRPQRALGVNSIDEVPSSTWFTNRIGVRELTPAEVQMGPLTIDSPERHRPWRIISGKRGGTQLGFIIEDARGVRWLLKFDEATFPELETTSQIVGNRLFWAAGYHVPEDRIVSLRPDDLVLDANAKTWSKLGHEQPLEQKRVDATLAAIDRQPDGTIRALVSRLIAGTVIPVQPIRGVRKDDPNDRIPHELRRDLRGATALFAWLDHGDLNNENFLDVWTPDPENPNHHYVMHYFIDFGRALGAMARVKHDPQRGFHYIVDFGEMTNRFVTLGIEADDWEKRSIFELRGVGLYDAQSYEPAKWKPDAASYTPWLTADRFDKFWGAKLIARFTYPQIRAAVQAAQMTDPQAAAYLADTLWKRARETARYYFTQVNPLDKFTIVAGTGGPQLCFDDLMITNRLERVAAKTHYTIARFDINERPVGEGTQIAAAPMGRSCTPPLSLAQGGYTIVRLTTTRPGFARSTQVHVAPDSKTQEPRIIGVWRE